MKILAVETSTESCSVAVWTDGAEYLRETIAGQRHSELLMGMLDETLKESGLRVADMDGIAFGSGPGSFTGIRIACGVVQGLAFGAHKPVIAIPSLLALAEAASACRVIAALDARMGETYLAAYERDGMAWKIVIEPCLADGQSLPPVDGKGWIGIGSGFDTHAYVRAAYGAQVSRVLSRRLPGALEVARLAVKAMAAGAATIPELAAPLYIRNKVALTSAERAEQRSRGVVQA
jgi:tRNA threonylcarbamoyladenosine biosynthesis protein TsaB